MSSHGLWGGRGGIVPRGWGKGWRQGESSGGIAAGHSWAHPCPHPHPIPLTWQKWSFWAPPPHLTEVVPPGPLGGSRPQPEEVQLRREDLLIPRHAGEDEEEPHLLAVSCGEGQVGK